MLKLQPCGMNNKECCEQRGPCTHILSERGCSPLRRAPSRGWVPRELGLGGAQAPRPVKQWGRSGRTANDPSQSRRQGARARRSVELRALSPRAARRPPPRRENPTGPSRLPPLSGPARLPGRLAVMEEDDGAEEQQRFSYRQRLKAAVHYTVGCLCEEVALDKETQFSKQAIAAISEVTFRQCENFAKDLEMFARHAKRSTINTEDVKLLARRSNSLLKYITEKNEEIAQFNLERKAKKKKKSEDENKNSTEQAEAGVVESEN
uniref:Centromere protein S n=3 Tax=Equus TaxID=9789 RepID=A0A9L0QZG1_HORSE